MNPFTDESLSREPFFFQKTAKRSFFSALDLFSAGNYYKQLYYPNNMEIMNIIVDLGAGLGGATEAFIECENWKVLRFDIAQEVEHVEEMRLVDYVNDTSEIIRYVRAEMHMLDLDEKSLYIWASPECKEWSDGFHSKKCKMRRRGETFVPDLTQLTAIKHIVEVLKPKAWIVENVKGGLEFINPVLGPPATFRNPIFLWGEFPLFRIPKNPEKKTDKGPSKTEILDPFKITN